MPCFQNIIFDLDGLMADTEPLHRRAFNLVLRACNADYEFDAVEYGQRITGRSIYENSEYVRERFALPQTAQEIANAHLALFNVLIADAENVQAMSGLEPLLRMLDAQPVRLAIASSSPTASIQTILRGLNLHHHFETVVGNDGDLKPKPAPDVYLRALEQLGALALETLALEDSFSGVRAAKAAGLFVIAVPNEYTRSQDFTAADVTMPDLHHVREFLRNSQV